jgi:hypothetical protein
LDNQPSSEQLDNDANRAADEENNVSIVETTEQKIISIELDSPLKSPSSGEEPHGNAFSEPTNPPHAGGGTNSNGGGGGGKKKKRKGSKKK